MADGPDARPAARGQRRPEGYDATDEQGRTYQIKSRLVESLADNTSFDLKSIDQQFQYLLGVFLSTDLGLLGVVRVPHDAVRELGSQSRDCFSFRWNRRTAQDPRVERLFWPSAASLRAS